MPDYEENPPVLYFDDNWSETESIVRYLESDGISVQVCNPFGMTPEEAAAKVNEVQPSAVLLEVNWSLKDEENRDGLDAAKIISPDHPVVIISSNSKHEEEALRYGMFCERDNRLGIASALRPYYEQG